jgi:hypothetical protein
MNVLQLVAPVVVAPINARKVSPEKALAKAKITKKAKPSAKAEVVVTELNALRSELQALSGAPCSPKMTIDQLKAKIEAIKNPTPEPEEVEEVEVVEKVKVIPSKPQGIGAFCVAQLKTGLAPKVVLEQALEKFPSAKTSMACVYWYASKIKQGLL